MTKAPRTLDDGRAPGEIPLSEIEAILEGRHTNLFAVLGLHKVGDVYRVRCFIPGAELVAELVQAKHGERVCVTACQNRLDLGQRDFARRSPIILRTRRFCHQALQISDAY